MLDEVQCACPVCFHKHVFRAPAALRTWRYYAGWEATLPSERYALLCPRPQPTIARVCAPMLPVCSAHGRLFSPPHPPLSPPLPLPRSLRRSPCPRSTYGSVGCQCAQPQRTLTDLLSLRQRAGLGDGDAFPLFRALERHAALAILDLSGNSLSPHSRHLNCRSRRLLPLSPPPPLSTSSIFLGNACWL